MTIPGVDATVALSLVAAVGDFRRFSRPERLVCYLGLNPRVSQRNVKRWQDGDMRKRRTAAGMLVAEQQFRRIIGYRALAKLVIAIERHTLLSANNYRDHQEIAQPVTV